MFIFMMRLWYMLMSGAFEGEDVTHVEGDVNPVRDLEIISEELRLKDAEYLQKAIVRKTAHFHIGI